MHPPGFDTTATRRAADVPALSRKRVKERRSGKAASPATNEKTPLAAKLPQESPKDRKIREELAKLSPADRALAEQQRFCIVLKESRLGSMGKPVKIKVGNETVFLCCEGCEDSAKEDPDATLARLRELRARSKSTSTPMKQSRQPPRKTDP